MALTPLNSLNSLTSLTSPFAKVELYLKKHAKHLALSTKKLIFAFECLLTQ